jgi:alpha-N-arabinofuranosidase
MNLHVWKLRHCPSPAVSLCGLALLCVSTALGQSPSSAAGGKIEIDAARQLGTISDFLFGQNIEYEHGTFSGGEQNMDHAHGLHTGGLWAEMLRDRKFEEGDLDRDGVANAWVPEERVANRYEQLVDGKGPNRQYRIDTAVCYGGGAAQAIDLAGDGSEHAGVDQVGLHFEKGKRYNFYVYLKLQGSGSAWMEFGNTWPKVYAHADFAALHDEWAKYEASFVAPETTDQGRVHIGVKGKGTFWIDSASLMPADTFHGMRADVMEALKDLPVPVLRYPGGCFADSYHWRDGIGDRDKRPERWSDFWNEWEPNDFGMDDFMLFAEALHTQPQITVNSLTGSPEEASDWVEYANGPSNTPMGKLRAQDGHADPYGIKLWAIGNEVQEMCSGQYIGSNNVDRYAERYKQYRSAMEGKDPNVEVIAVGAGPGPLKWNHDLLDRVDGVPALGVSIYTGNGKTRTDDFDTKYMDLNEHYRRVVAEPLDFDRQLSDVIGSIGDRMPSHPFVAVTEFQSWWLTEKVDEDLRLADALYLGMVYHSLFRHAKQVSIAEIESIINVQGVIEISQTSVKRTPEYFASILYQKHTGKTVLKTTTAAPGVEFNAKLPALDAIATVSADRHTLYLAVVNRAEKTDIDTQISVSGWNVSGSSAHAFELNGNSEFAANPFGSAENVNIHEKPVSFGAGSPRYTFSAHSITILEFFNPQAL